MLFAMNPKYSRLAPADKLPTLVPGRVTSPSLEEVGNFIKNTTESGYLIKNEDVHRELMRHGGFGVPRLRHSRVVSDEVPITDLFPEISSDSSPGNGNGGNGNSGNGNGNGNGNGSGSGE